MASIKVFRWSAIGNHPIRQKSVPRSKSLDETGEVSIVTEVPQAQVLKETVFKGGAEISSSAMGALKTLRFDKTKISRKTIVFMVLLLLAWLFLQFTGVTTFFTEKYFVADKCLVNELHFFKMILVVLCALAPILPVVWKNPIAHFVKCMSALAFIVMCVAIDTGSSVWSWDAVW